MKNIRASDNSWRAAAWLLNNAQPATGLERGAAQQRRQATERFWLSAIPTGIWGTRKTRNPQQSAFLPV